MTNKGITVDLATEVSGLLGPLNKIVRSAGYPAIPPPGHRVQPLKESTLPERWGVYFAWENGQIAYVGQSRNLRQRVCCSHQYIDSDDGISYIEMPWECVSYAECFYIGITRPWRNFCGNGNWQMLDLTKMMRDSQQIGKTEGN